MVYLEGLDSFAAQVAAGYFWPDVEPFGYRVADLFGDHFGFAFGAADTQAGGADTAMKLGAVKFFAPPLSVALDNIDTVHASKSSMGKRADGGNVFDVHIKSQHD